MQNTSRCVFASCHVDGAAAVGPGKVTRGAKQRERQCDCSVPPPQPPPRHHHTHMRIRVVEDMWRPPFWRGNKGLMRTWEEAPLVVAVARQHAAPRRARHGPKVVHPAFRLDANESRRRRNLFAPRGLRAEDAIRTSVSFKVSGRLQVLLVDWAGAPQRTCCACSRMRALVVFGWVVFLISSAHLHVRPVRCIVRADERAKSNWPPLGYG